MPLKSASNDNLKWRMIAFPQFFLSKRYNFSRLDENRNCRVFSLDGVGWGGGKEGDFPKHP